MKHAALVLLVTARGAAADPDPLVLRPIKETAELVVASDIKNCETSEVAGIVATKSRVVGTSRVTIVHGCGMTDRASVLVIHHGDRWFASDMLTISYYAANMTEAPLEVSFVGERLVPGSLDDGTAAVALVTLTRARTVKRCYDEPGCTPIVVTSELKSSVEVCTVDEEPACAMVNAGCPARGCAPVRLARGVLLVGSERIPIRRGPVTAPPP